MPIELFEDMRRTLDAYLGEDELSPARRATRRRIVAAATELFAHYGYRKTSIDDIARRAGIGKGTLYLYFESKIDLMVIAIAYEKRQHLDELRPVLELPPEQRLRAYLSLALRMAGGDMPLTAKLLGGDHEILTVLAEVDPSELAKWNADGSDFLGTFLAAAGGDRWTPDELRDRAMVVRGLLFLGGLLSSEQVRAGIPLDTFADVLAELVVDGVRPRSEVGA